jgi:uncharacterized protein (DUF1499 family)
MDMKNLLLVMVIACGAMTGMNGLNAQTVYYVKADGTGNGSSWANAAGNIQDMIDKAAKGDQIWVAKGVYYPTTQTNASDARSKTFLMKDGVHLYGGFTGNETKISDRTRYDWDDNGKIEDWEFTGITYLSGDIDGTRDAWSKVDFSGVAYRWSVSGNSGNARRVVTFPAEVGNETIMDGFTVECGTEVGIYTRGKSKIQNCSVAFNSGFGIDNEIGIVTNSEICYTNGRGIWNNKGIVSNCNIYLNYNYNSSTTTSNYGGGVNNVAGEIINCSVMNNCIITYYNSSTNNSVHPIAGGGGICNATGKIDKCIVAGNIIYSYNGATGGSMLSSLAYGGGIYNSSSGVISNCCVFNNKATAERRSTALGNMASTSGGGINNNSAGIIYNSTVVNNRGNSSGENNIAGTGINCISSASNASQHFINPTTFIGRATTAAQETELLKAGWRLKEGSSYINAGSLAGLPDWLISGPDLAGKPRVTNGKISSGAYEYDPSYTGIAELKPEDFVVYPAVTSGIVHINHSQGETVEVYGISGNLIIKTAESTIDLSGYPKGMYLIKSGNRTVKVIRK